MCLQVMAATGPQLQELFMKDSIQDLVFSSGYSGVLCAASKERVVADVLLQNVAVLRHAALEQLAKSLTSLGVLDLLRGHVNMMSGLLVSPPTFMADDILSVMVPIYTGEPGSNAREQQAAIFLSLTQFLEDPEYGGV